MHGLVDDQPLPRKAASLATDRLVPGDFVGDCKTDIAIYPPSNGTWFVQQCVLTCRVGKVEPVL